jgi:hypothetical protein
MSFESLMSAVQRLCASVEAAATVGAELRQKDSQMLDSPRYGWTVSDENSMPAQTK